MLFMANIAVAQQLAQPPGANLTFGDVTHGMRALSASTNPAAAAAHRARDGEQVKSATAPSAAVGIEYGNIEELWDFYDELSQAFSKSDPGVDIGGPGQLPEEKPDDGIDLGEIWDLLDPDIQTKVTSIAQAVGTKAAALALIRAEGYGKAWLATDVPLVFKTERLGGTWTMQLHWSGTARAFGLTDDIEFSAEEARLAVENWFNTNPTDRPQTLRVGDQVRLAIDELGNVNFALENDSLLVSQASRLSAISVGYGRPLWRNDMGTVYGGTKAHLYNMRLSRYGVRFGDITDSKKLFDEIRSADFETDIRIGVDIGLLWVGRNYQLGAQLRNINEPVFRFPDIFLPIRNEELLQRVRRSSTYTMDRQLKLEASLFSRTQRWSFHLAGDAQGATDPVGNEYQWLTASAGYNRGGFWIPGIRFGYRKNLEGTNKAYASIGATLFKYLNVDIASALDRSEIDGRRLPESLIVSVGFRASW